jgi:sodium transport system permease protein
MKNIGVVYRKEMKDALRDPRTILLMIIFPLLINPLIFFGIGKMAASEEKQINSTHFVIAVQGLSELPALADSLRANPNITLVDATDPKADVLSKRAAAALIIPAGSGAKLEAGQQLEAKIEFDSGREIGRHARDVAEKIIEGFSRKAGEQGMLARGVPTDLVHLVKVKKEDQASAARQAGRLLGVFLPYMLTIGIANGVTSTAIDVTSGEKDRGTLETVLVSSKDRTDILVGKLLAVVTTGFVAVTSSALSLALVMTYGNALGGTGGFTISPGAIVGVVLLSVPLAVLFSAVLMALGCFAKSAKEGQTQAVYVQMLLIFSGISTLVKQTEPTDSTFRIPVLGTSMAQRELLLGEFHPQHILSAVLCSSLLAVVAIFVAIRLFGNEQVMFRSK